MLITLILALLLIVNWLLSETLVAIPINLLAHLSSLSWLGLTLFLMLFLGWCMAED